MTYHLCVLFLLLIHFLYLLPVYEHYVGKKVIYYYAVAFFRLNYSLDLEKQLKHQDETVLAGCHEISSTGAEADGWHFIDVNVLAIHDDRSLQPSKDNDFPIIQGKNESLFFSNKNFSHLNDLGIKFVLANSVGLAVMLF